jgi:hypothetical protein
MTNMLFFGAIQRAMMKPAIFGVALCVAVTQFANAQYNPAFEWQTGKGALMCPNFFTFKEARAAVNATDATWLRSTGCFFANPGWKLALIDARNTYPAFNDIWHGRVYPPDGAPLNAYFLGSAAVTYAIYGPFRNRTEAERETTLLIEKLSRVDPDLGHAIPYQVTASGGAFMARVGPEVSTMMDLFCAYTGRARESHPVPPCKAGKLP